MFTNLLVFSRLLLFAFFGSFFGVFPGDFGFSSRNLHPNAQFLNCFLSVGKWTPMVDNGPLSVCFHPLAETSSYPAGDLFP